MVDLEPEWTIERKDSDVLISIQGNLSFDHFSDLKDMIDEFLREKCECESCQAPVYLSTELCSRCHASEYGPA
jgi:hypothetical protein